MPVLMTPTMRMRMKMRTPKFNKSQILVKNPRLEPKPMLLLSRFLRID
jgi:hypothetical protein